MADRFAVLDPATLEQVGECPDAGEEQFASALAAAGDAFEAWSSRPPSERVALIEKLAELIIANHQRLAELNVRESGKPLAEAHREVASSAAYLRFNAAECLKSRDREVGVSAAGARLRVAAEPAGVAIAITPWNYPLNTLCRKLGPALAAGCTLISKPAPETPLSAMALARLADQAGFPPGVFTVVTTTRAEAAVSFWMNDWRVRRVGFTGSTAVGRELVRLSASRFQKLSLELGGNAPALVFADANLDRAAAEIVGSRFRHSGQTCVCIQRVFVERSAADGLLERLIARISALRTGNGMSDPDCGPLIREEALRRCERHVADAVSVGAKVAAGGRHLILPNPDRGWFFEPTLLTNVPQSALILREEVFGPVLALATFGEEAEAVRMANETDYGLVAYAFTADEGRERRLAVALRAGTVGINTTAVVSPNMPFGGLKASGIGKENGPDGFDEYLDIKSIVSAEFGKAQS